MDSSRSHRLAFLLSLGAVPLACTDGKDDTSAGATTGETVSGTTSGSTDGMTAGTASTSASSGDETTGTTSTTGDPGALCPLYAQSQVECGVNVRYDVALCYCEHQLAWGEALGPVCKAAVDALLACQGLAASCDGTECQAEGEAFFNDCDNDPAPGAACSAWGPKLVECIKPTGDAASEAALCQYAKVAQIANYGADCGLAYEELYVCLAIADCAAIDDETACPVENQNYLAACSVPCSG